ncbi:protein kinase [Streptacidiphilus sp. N1-10]|uniref:non-specific serine/threonine protein kinase n=1 Tax=Streptacidiphilus jeojiensis TaxID=3229225 RepID=A0ABV6XFW4_9ACTN
MTLPVWDGDFHLSGANLFAGRYRLGRILGRGGAATVHQALDERLGRQVAIKVFRSDAESDLVRRFEVEARLLARLDHPGLVRIFDYGHTPQGPYLVLELLPGPSLSAALVSGGPRGTDETLRIGSDLARTLEYVHSQGVVHRDVKPANILFDEEGRPRLADFGISRVVDTAGSTRTGTVMGTAAYLAPEQVRGRRAGPTADVFALGLVLIECLTGRREYAGTPVEAAIARLRRPPTIPTGLPRALTQLLELMTRVNPDERVTAEECTALLAESLRRIGQPEAPPESSSGAPPVPPTAVATARPTVTPHHGSRRRRGPLAAAGALVIGGVLAGIVATHGGAPQHPAAHQSSAPAGGVTAGPTGGHPASVTGHSAARQSTSAAPPSATDPSPSASASGSASASYGQSKKPKSKVKDPGQSAQKKG